jgi:hypothetical protein
VNRRLHRAAWPAKRAELNRLAACPDSSIAPAAIRPLDDEARRLRHPKSAQLVCASKSWIVARSVVAGYYRCGRVGPSPVRRNEVATPRTD